MSALPLDRPWNRERTRRRFIESEPAYGMGRGPAAFQDQREREYPALKDTVYIDYAASPPVSQSTVRAFATAISSTLYSNPHSRSTSSRATSDAIADVRLRVLEELFGLKDPEARAGWDVVWTSGATASLKLVAERFPWNGERKGRYLYLKEAHTSLVGVRGVALEKGAIVDAMDDDEVEAWLENGMGGGGRKLFAYPAQCNATGSRLGLELGRRAKRRDPATSVLVDAAAWLATTPLPLSSVPFDEAPDFIVCSMYKLFGYPTGLGCLVVRLADTGSTRLMSGPRGYFGGGTIDAVSVDAPFWVFPRRSPSDALPSSTSASTSSPRASPTPTSSSSSSHSLSHSHSSSTPPTSVSFSTHIRRPHPPIHEALEDGTLPFLSIIALDHAMTAHQTLYTSHSSVSAHASSLAFLARRELSTLRHATGVPVVRLHTSFGSLAKGEPGPTIAFTLVEPSGKPVGHVFLDNLATVASFQLRTGGLCNTGVVSQAGDLDDVDLLEDYHRGRRCGDEEEFYDEDNSRPLGLARISFGAASTVDDALDWVDFLRKYFVVSQEVVALARRPVAAEGSATLDALVLYPIKSCGGQSLPASASWEISPTGLEFDREWMLVSPTTGKALSQKRLPRMALIKPVIDLRTRTLRISAPAMPDLVLPLDPSPSSFEADAKTTEAQLCEEVVSVQPSTPAVDTWFSSFLGVACRLHRVPPGGGGRHGHFDRASRPVPILLSNESPFLLISRESVAQVNEWIVTDSPSPRDGPSSPPPVDAACFRANFILSSIPSVNIPPFFEDGITLLRIGSATFQVLARCRRCLMVSVDQARGEKSKEPFSCLAKERKNERGRIEFGVHLVWREDLSEGVHERRGRVAVGDRVVFDTEE